MHRSKMVYRVWAILMPLYVVTLILAGCRNPASEKPAQANTTDPAFVGNEACKPCHASEYSAHHLSLHNMTMRPATCSALGQHLPALGVVPLAGYALDKQGDSLGIARNAASGSERQRLDLVLGSGKFGMTFVSMVGTSQLMETKMSYFPAYKIWDLTPGQEVHVAGDTQFGRLDTTDAAKRCLGCHSTALPAKGLSIMPESRFFGVGCEACHGAGRAHIDAERAGRVADTKMANLSNITPSKLNALCGKCHRNVSDVDVDSPEVNLTYRFQPYAMQRSACRTGANEPLSCLYCHDAHTNVSHDLTRYEAVCLTCHSKPGGSENPYVPVDIVDVRKGRVCPVNQKTGCTGCHMRPRIAFPLTTLPGKMADHLITPPGAERRRVTPRLNLSYDWRHKVPGTGPTSRASMSND